MGSTPRSNHTVQIVRYNCTSIHWEGDTRGLWPHFKGGEEGLGTWDAEQGHAMCGVWPGSNITGRAATVPCLECGILSLPFGKGCEFHILRVLGTGIKLLMHSFIPTWSLSLLPTTPDIFRADTCKLRLPLKARVSMPAFMVLVGAAVWGRFRRCSHPGGSMSLGKGFESFKPQATSSLLWCEISASRSIQHACCLLSCLPAMKNICPSGAISQNKPLL